MTMVLWAAWLLGLQVSATRASLATASGADLVLDLGFWGVDLTLGVVAFAMAGLLVTLRRPENVIGWLCLALAFAVVVHTAAFEWSLHTFETAPGSLPAGTQAALLSAVSGELMMPLPLTLIVLTFPSGRLRGVRYRGVAGLAVLCALLAATGQLTARRVYAGEHTAVANPLAAAWLPPPLPQTLVSIGELAGVAVLALAVLGFVIHTWRASKAERRQLSWFAAVGAIGVVILVIAALSALLRLPWVTAISVVSAGAALAIGLPITIWVAIGRHQLYEVDRLLNRALVYAALTISLIAIYSAAVALVSVAFQVRVGPAASLVAAGLAVITFAPLRAGLQLAVNRVMYGRRGDPYAVLTVLGRRLEATASPEAMLKMAAESIADAIQVPHVAIRFAGGALAAQHGEPAGDDVEVPLVHAGERVGTLVLSRDAPSRLVEDLARHLATAVKAARVTVELQEARERLVSATEEERRTLRRELHDGLGPTLAGITLGIQAARRQVARDPEGAQRALAEVAEELRAAVSDIRRLARGLRPRSLDDLGLVGAVREQVARYSSQDSGLEVMVEASGELDRLPAAVEVAAFRIALEAVTNAVRHSLGRRCKVRFELNGDLTVEVSDDGRGLPPDLAPGVGVSSMRARAEELGGRCILATGPAGGTRVVAYLPIDEHS